MSAHADFAPSSAERNCDCPASWAINRKLPDRESIYSATGTFAHSILDKANRESKSPWDYVGEFTQVEINGAPTELLCDEKMGEALQEVQDRYFEIPGDHFFEQKVDISRWTPWEKQFGTLDHAVVSADTVYIDDLKFGEGVRVDAFENKQAIQYALGWLDDYGFLYDVRRVVIRIMQPRLDHFDTWECSVERLREFGTAIKAKLFACLDPNPTFGPSEKACKFCKYRQNCPALASKINAAAALAFDDLIGDFETPIEAVSLPEMVEAWNTRKLYQIRFEAIQDALSRRLLGGESVPGLKAVEGRTHRRWKSLAEASNVMTAAGIARSRQEKKSLISPAQALKLMTPAQRKDAAEAIIKPPGAPTIVAENDPRPAYGERRTEVFDDMAEEETEE